MGYETLHDQTLDYLFKLTFPSPLNLLYSNHIANLPRTQRAYTHPRTFAISGHFRLFLQKLIYVPYSL